MATVTATKEVTTQTTTTTPGFQDPSTKADEAIGSWITTGSTNDVFPTAMVASERTKYIKEKHENSNQTAVIGSVY